VSGTRSSGFSRAALQSEDFNGLTIGNVTTDATGVTAGQGGWLTASSNGTAPTTSNNAGVTNYQVIAAGNNTSQGLQIISPNGDKGSRFMWKNGLDVAWAARTTGNNVIELEYDFFTGPITDTRSQVGMRLYGNENVDGVPTVRTLIGFVYTTNTRALQGVAYLQNGATKGTFLVNLAATPIILDANTWYRIGCSYNVTTGQTLWRTNSTTPAGGLAAANWIPNLAPTEIDFVQIIVGANPTAVPPVPANTATSTLRFDNYISRAVATSDLLSTNDIIAANEKLISIYPNPANNVLNINAIGSAAITAVQVVDLNGRQVMTTSFDSISDAQINVSQLTAGMYLINITAGEQTVTKKFLKN